MLKSMTGFGSAVHETDKFTIKAEIKTLNSRNFDFKSKLPPKYFSKEIDIQSIIENSVVRGKTDFLLQIKYNDPYQNIRNINKDIADAYFSEISSLFDKWQQPKDQAARIVFTFPDVFSNEPAENGIDEEEWEETLRCLRNAISKLDNYRLIEGKKLENQIIEYINKLVELKGKITQLAKERITNITEKLSQRISEVSQLLNSDRLEQEIIYYVEKLDITEEIDRLEAHLSYFREVMINEENSGRKLTFISQEIGREINTIGSKANDHGIQKIVVEMKEELEKIKQQLANIL